MRDKISCDVKQSATESADGPLSHHCDELRIARKCYRVEINIESVDNVWAIILERDSIEIRYCPFCGNPLLHPMKRLTVRLFGDK